MVRSKVRFGGIVSALLIIILVLVVPVSAHHPEVSGEAVCNTQTGNYDITWTVTNSESSSTRIMKITSVSRDVGIVVNTLVAASASVQGFESVAGNTTGDVTLTVEAKWDYVNPAIVASRTGKVTLNGTCKKPERTPEPTQEVTSEPTQEVTDDPGTPEVTAVVTQDPQDTPEPTSEVTDNPSTPEVTPVTPESTEGPQETPEVTRQVTGVPTNPPPPPLVSWTCKFESIAQYWFFKRIPQGWAYGGIPFQMNASAVNIWIGNYGTYAPVGQEYAIYVYSGSGDIHKESSYVYLASFHINGDKDCAKLDPSTATPRPMPASGSNELPDGYGPIKTYWPIIAFMLMIVGAGVVWFYVRRSRN